MAASSLEGKLLAKSNTFESSQAAQDHYNYEALAHKNSIRLLELLPSQNQYEPLQGQIFEQEDYVHAKYDALSYVWGPPDFEGCLLLGGQSFPISAALHSALRHIRLESSPRLLWIDAICINQKNDSEKMNQISSMGSIYKSAEQVLIWLGESTTDSRQAFEYLDQVARRYHYSDDKSAPLMRGFSSIGDRNIGYTISPHAHTEADLICKAARSSHLEDVLARPWFTRLWIVQELLLSKSAVLICGSDKLPWDLFSYAIIILHEVLNKNGNVAQLASFRPAWNIVQLQEQNRFSRLAFSTTMLLRAPITFLAFMSKQQCKEEKDRLFGILGLEDSHLQYVGIDPSLLKYSMTAEEAFTLLSILYLSRGSERVSRIINYSGLSRHSQVCRADLPAGSTDGLKNGTSNLPSWALDLGNPETFQRFPWCSNNFSAGGDWKVGYKLRGPSSLGLSVCPGSRIYMVDRPIVSSDLDYFCSLWVWIQYRVGFLLSIAGTLPSEVTENGSAGFGELIDLESLEKEDQVRLFRTLLADGVALVPELDILNLSEEPPRWELDDLRKIWSLFVRHFLSEGGELREKYEKLSGLSLSMVVQQDGSILGETTRAVTEVEMRQDLSEEAIQAWKVYVALQSLFQRGVFAVLLDGKIAILPDTVGNEGGEVFSVPGLEMPQILRSTGLAEEVEGQQIGTYQLIGPGYVDGLMDGEGISYTKIGHDEASFPATIVV